ncbi:MAG: antitoxin [Actinomycetota bacterium]|nr:antitoxin [Actinomycetota bacterium]
MRTTLSIDDHLLVEAKRRAAERGLTLGELVEHHLREGLARAAAPARPAGDIPVFQGRGGLQPGVDITSNASLLEAMEDGASR